MKTLVWIVVGVLIGIASWIPINLADRYSIPFTEAVIAIAGTIIGGIIVLVAIVQWVRYGSRPPPQKDVDARLKAGHDGAE